MVGIWEGRDGMSVSHGGHSLGQPLNPLNGMEIFALLVL